MTNAKVIEMNEVTKSFDKVTALNRCSLKEVFLRLTKKQEVE